MVRRKGLEESAKIPLDPRTLQFLLANTSIEGDVWGQKSSETLKAYASQGLYLFFGDSFVNSHQSETWWLLAGVAA